MLRRHKSCMRNITGSIATTLLPVAMLLGVLSFQASAQTAGAGALTGTLTDASGAVAPAVTVVVRSRQTGSERSVTTNNDGIHFAAFLQPGGYDLAASKPGFATIVRKGLTVQVGQTLTIDFQLPIQARKETITVTSDAPVVDQEKRDVSQVISAGLVENLPLVGRRWDNFVLLTPAVTMDGNSVSFRGISSLYNNNSVDGANNDQAFFSTARGGSTAP